jgi:hypothetical protein
MFRCNAAVGVWDDHSKGNDFLKCKNIRIENNLVFQTVVLADMGFYNHRREGPLTPTGPCDLKRLLNNPEWHFGHNWRETDRQRGASVSEHWIPLSPTDHQLAPNGVLSKKPGDPNFLRPAKDSQLATSGAGVTDPSLPAYVGAVPPEGVEPWDWQKTWLALTR